MSNKKGEKLGVVFGQHPPAKRYQFLPPVRFGINVRSLYFLNQRQVADASMRISTLLGFLTIVAIAKAAKPDEEPLDIIVVDALGKGWQENTGCVDTMARNGG